MGTDVSVRVYIYIYIYTYRGTDISMDVCVILY